MTENEREQLQPVLNRVATSNRWIDCGPGWWPLILKLDHQLAEIEPDYRVMQVKEKFGGLRYYIGAVAKEHFKQVHELIAAAEHESYATCEMCGQPGALRTGNWMKTLCDEHAQGRPRTTMEEL